MEIREHIRRLSRCKQHGGSYAQAREFVGALLPLKGNQGRVAWRWKVSEARGAGPQVRSWGLLATKPRNINPHSLYVRVGIL